MAAIEPYYQIYQDGSHFWRWRFRAANHEIVASGEAYVNKQDCLHAISLIATSGSCKVYPSNT